MRRLLKDCYPLWDALHWNLRGSDKQANPDVVLLSLKKTYLHYFVEVDIVWWDTERYGACPMCEWAVKGEDLEFYCGYGLWSKTEESVR